MRFRLLGPLQVFDGESWVTVPAAQQRVVLAVLLVEAGRVVATERLVDEVWGARPPRSAVTVVQGYVGKLRQLLRAVPEVGVVSCGRGYQLLVGDDAVDVRAFERLVAGGGRACGEGRPDAAVDLLGEALRLWHGAPLGDVPVGPTVTAEAVRLAAARLAAVELRLDALLEVGEHAEVVGEARRLVADHPARERPHAQLMLGLYRCGRRVEALDAYREAHRLLADQFGVEPGPQLRELHQQILADHPGLAGPPRPEAPTVIRPAPGGVVPAQLPPGVAAFTGRAGHLQRLDDLLPGREGAPPVLVISTIAGTAGIGKTALAVHWAHRVRDRFPDGQLYLNLHGYAARPPLRPIDALARILPALGVAAKEVPDDVGQAAAVYRSLLVGKRVLVLLDNVNHPDQVRPLLPGSPGAVVLVTSRDQLRGLTARDGAVRLDLDVPGPDEAQALLARLLGAQRVRAEPEPAARLAQLCGHLPLALRIAAANLTAHPDTSIAAYVDQLAAEDRLAALSVDGDPQASVEVAFSHSYTALPDRARRLFRLLGLVPGPDVTADAAATLAGTSSGEAAKVLDRLAAAHLVQEYTPGRYALHDLIRLFATAQAAIEDPAAAR